VFGPFWEFQNGKIVPQIITILMDHPNEAWGDPCYPVVG
jgi:hypothetical protein